MQIVSALLWCCMRCFLLLCENQKVGERKRGKTKAAASSAKIEGKKNSQIVFSWIHSGAAHRFFMSHPSDSLVFCHLPQLAALSTQLAKRKSEKKITSFRKKTGGSTFWTRHFLVYAFNLFKISSVLSYYSLSK